MVSLKDVKASNAGLKSTGSGLVAVFVGATGGIGQSALKKLVQNTQGPKIYIAGRSESTVSKIIDVLKQINGGGQYIFVKGEDLTLLRVVDQVCDVVKREEKRIDLLWMSAGYISLEGRKETPEGLDALLCLRYYSRMRFIYNLLPQLNTAPNGRVVSCLAAGQEGKIFPDDLGLRQNYGFINGTNASATYNTLALEHLASENPKVGFVHYFPSLVNTNVFTIQGLGAIPQFFIDWVFKPLLTPMMVSIDETGERGMFHATSDRYPAANASNKGDQVARGTTGEIGSGAYALNWNGEPSNSEKVLGPMRKEGIPRKIWEHTISEFERIGRL